MILRILAIYTLLAAHEALWAHRGDKKFQPKVKTEADVESASVLNVWRVEAPLDPGVSAPHLTNHWPATKLY